MKNFPSNFTPTNQNFSEINKKRIQCYLRREIYEHVISHKEDEYFSLDTFSSKFNMKLEDIKEQISCVVEELKNINWKCSYSYGETALFIYREEKPKNCWDE